MPSRAGSLETCGFKQRFWSLLGLRPKVTRARGRGTPHTGSMAERRTGRRGRRPLRVREGGQRKKHGRGRGISPLEEGDHCSLRAMSAAARVGAEAIRCGTFLHRNCNRTKGIPKTIGFWRRFCSLLPPWAKGCRAGARNIPLAKEQEAGRRGCRPLRVREGECSERNAGGGAEHSPVEEGGHCSLRAMSAAARVGAEAIRCGTFLHRNCNRTKGIPKTIGFWRRFCSLLPPWAKGCRAGARNIPLAKEQEAGRRGRRPLRVREGGCSERNAPERAEHSPVGANTRAAAKKL